jgi:hypothetical protein
MSNDADLEYGPTPPGSAYEHTDVAPGVAYNFAIWLGVAMLVSGAIVYGTFWYLEGRSATLDQSSRTYPLAVGQSQDPPAPRLQVQPFKDVWELKNSQGSALNSYGWVDKASGVVHIPIQRAMQITLERGLPVRDTDPASATGVITQDSSSGRTTAPR